MKFIDIVKKRKSVRSYSSKNISKEDLDLILESGRLAPSAKNLQEWKFVVVKNRELLAKMVAVCKGQKFVAEANSLIVGYSSNLDYVMTCGQPAYTIDISIALTQMMLQASELGIGSCWLGAFYENQAKELLGISKENKIVGILTLGYPKDSKLEDLPAKSRKDLNEIVEFLD